MIQFKRKVKAVVYLLVLTSLTACATTPQNKISRFVKTGESVEILNFGFWNGDCSPMYFNLKIESQPTHGEVETAKSTVTISKKPDIGRASSNCSGRSVESKALIYNANNEFTGKDIVEVSVQAPGLAGWKRYLATVYVTQKKVVIKFSSREVEIEASSSVLRGGPELWVSCSKNPQRLNSVQVLIGRTTFS